MRKVIHEKHYLLIRSVGLMAHLRPFLLIILIFLGQHIQAFDDIRPEQFQNIRISMNNLRRFLSQGVEFQSVSFENWQQICNNYLRNKFESSFNNHLLIRIKHKIKFDSNELIISTEIMHQGSQHEAIHALITEWKNQIQSDPNNLRLKYIELEPPDTIDNQSKLQPDLVQKSQINWRLDPHQHPGLNIKTYKMPGISKCPSELSIDLPVNHQPLSEAGQWTEHISSNPEIITWNYTGSSQPHQISILKKGPAIESNEDHIISFAKSEFKLGYHELSGSWTCRLINGQTSEFVTVTIPNNIIVDTVVVNGEPYTPETSRDRTLSFRFMDRKNTSNDIKISFHFFAGSHSDDILLPLLRFNQGRILWHQIILAHQNDLGIHSIRPSSENSIIRSRRFEEPKQASKSEFDVINPIFSDSVLIKLNPKPKNRRFQSESNININEDRITCSFIIDIPDNIDSEMQLIIHLQPDWAINKFRAYKDINKGMIAEQTVDFKQEKGVIKVLLSRSDQSKTNKVLSINFVKQILHNKDNNITLPYFELNDAGELSTVWNIKSDSRYQTIEVLHKSPVWFQMIQKDISLDISQDQEDSLSKRGTHHLISLMTLTSLNKDPLKIQFKPIHDNKISHLSEFFMMDSHDRQVFRVTFYLKDKREFRNYVRVYPDYKIGLKNSIFEPLPQNAEIQSRTHTNESSSSNVTYFKVELISEDEIITLFDELFKKYRDVSVMWLNVDKSTSFQGIRQPQEKDIQWFHQFFSTYLISTQTPDLQMIQTQSPDIRRLRVKDILDVKNILVFQGASQPENSESTSFKKLIPIETRINTRFLNNKALYNVYIRFNKSDSLISVDFAFEKNLANIIITVDGNRIMPLNDPKRVGKDHFRCNDVCDFITISFESPLSENNHNFQFPDSNLIIPSADWIVRNNSESSVVINNKRSITHTKDKGFIINPDRLHNLRIFDPYNQNYIVSEVLTANDKNSNTLRYVFAIILIILALLLFSRMGFTESQLVKIKAIGILLALLGFFFPLISILFSFIIVLGSCIYSAKRLRFRKIVLPLFVFTCYINSVSPTAKSQDLKISNLIPILMPYDDTNGLSMTPQMIFVPKSTFEAMKDEVNRSSSLLKSGTLITNATHKIELISKEQFRIDSDYQVEESKFTNSSTLTMIRDSAKTTRITFDNKTVPIRFSSDSRNIAVEIPENKRGILRVIKDFDFPDNIDTLNVSIISSLKCEIKSVHRLSFEGNRIRIHNELRKQMDSQLVTPLSDSLMIQIHDNLQSNKINQEDQATDVFGIDTGGGIIWVVRSNRKDQDVINLGHLKDGVYLISSGTDQSVFSFPKRGMTNPETLKSTSTISGQTTSEVSLFQDYNNTGKYKLADLLHRSLHFPGKVRVYLGSVRGLDSQWLVENLQPRNSLNEDFYSIDSIGDYQLDSYVELDNWQNASFDLLRKTTDSPIHLQTVIRFTGRFLFCHYTFDIQRDSIDSNRTEFRFELPKSLMVFNIKSNDLISWIQEPSEGEFNEYKTTFQLTNSSSVKIEVDSVFEISRPVSMQIQNNGVLTDFPWPRLNKNLFPAGRLICEQQLPSNTSTFKNPMIIDANSVRSLGEIRDRDTPLDVRQWYYQVNEHTSTLKSRWVKSEPFSQVSLSHRLTLERLWLNWDCTISYHPLQGPLSVILLKTGRGQSRRISIDSPLIDRSDYIVSTYNEVDFDIISIQLTKPLVGEIQFTLHDKFHLIDSKDFNIPEVLPLGPGVVESAVHLISSEFDYQYVSDINVKGYSEETSSLPIDDLTRVSRIWQVKDPDNSFQLSFKTRQDVEDLQLSGWVVSNVILDSIDGDTISWTGDIVSAQNRIERLRWPSELGEIKYLHNRGEVIPYSIDGDIINFEKSVDVNRISFFAAKENLGLDNLFDVIKKLNKPSDQTEVVFAIRSRDEARILPYAKRVSVVSWLLSGLSTENSVISESDYFSQKKLNENKSLFKTRFSSFARFQPELSIIFRRVFNQAFNDNVNNSVTPEQFPQLPSLKGPLFCDLTLQDELRDWCFFIASDKTNDSFTAFSTELDNFYIWAPIFLSVFAIGSFRRK